MLFAIARRFSHVVAQLTFVYFKLFDISLILTSLLLNNLHIADVFLSFFLWSEFHLHCRMVIVKKSLALNLIHHNLFITLLLGSKPIS